VPVFAVLVGFLVVRTILKQLGAEPVVLAKVAGRIADGALGGLAENAGGGHSGVYADMLRMAERLTEVRSSGVASIS
jgi:hypothetical protein